MKQRSIREVAVAALEIAEANPDWYRSIGGSRYIDKQGNGSCLFGQALVRVFGKKVVPLIRDLECEGRTIGVVMALLKVGGISYEDATQLVEVGMTSNEMQPLMRAMWKAQAAQDQGEVWAACVALLRQGLIEDLGGKP